VWGLTAGSWRPALAGLLATGMCPAEHRQLSYLHCPGVAWTDTILHAANNVLRASQASDMSRTRQMAGRVVRVKGQRHRKTVPHLQQLPPRVVRVRDLQRQVPRRRRRGVHILGELRCAGFRVLTTIQDRCTTAICWSGQGPWVSGQAQLSRHITFLRILRMPCMLSPTKASRCCTSRATTYSSAADALHHSRHFSEHIHSGSQNSVICRVASQLLGAA
jgi:hypothetical protein